MKFDKNMLDKLEYVDLVLENCECFRIEAGDVLDFWTSEINMDKESNGVHYADDGGMIISKNAFRNLSSFVTQPDEGEAAPSDYDPKESYYLYNRIMDCCCDICQIEVKVKGENGVLFYVPYDPLENLMTGAEIDHSNCPSAELNENGDMLILFGKSSHSYRRTDNNYSDLIIGLSDIIKEPIDDELQVEIKEFSSNDFPGRCPRLFVEVVLKNAKCSDKIVELVFEDVTKPQYEVRFSRKKRRLLMSRISSDEIYVEFEDFVAFYCTAIKTYKEYISRLEKSIDGENADICARAINCELNESEMLSLDVCSRADCEADFSLDAFVAAKDKAFGGEISVKYFRSWLEAYSQMIMSYMDRRCREDDFHNALLTLLDRLQIRLSYLGDLSDCKEFIARIADEIERLCLLNSKNSSD